MTIAKQARSARTETATAKGRPVDLTQDDIDALAGEGAKADAVRERLASYEGKQSKASVRTPATMAAASSKTAPSLQPPDVEAK